MSLIALAAAASADAAHGASAGLPQFDPSSWPSQLFWLAVTFGVLYTILAGKVLPKIGGAIEERRDRIADDLDKASESKREAEEAETAYNQALADAKAKAQGIAADRRAEVDAEIAKLQSASDAELEKQLSAAEARIGDMKSQAAVKVREAARDTARTVVETLIDEAPTDEAVDRALDQALGA